jgi:hypothetical protein
MKFCLSALEIVRTIRSGKKSSTWNSENCDSSLTICSVFNPQVLENNERIFKNSVFGCFLRADLEIDFEKALTDAIVTLSIVDWDETKQNETICIKYGINDELDSLKRRYAS